MGQKITCACGKRLAVKESFQGSSIKCPACGARVPVADDAEYSISIRGIHHRDSSNRRSRPQSPAWVVPVACTLLGVVLTVIVWVFVSGQSDSDASPDRKAQIADAGESANPFARAQNAPQQFDNSSRVNRPVKNRPSVDTDDDDDTIRPKRDEMPQRKRMDESPLGRSPAANATEDPQDAEDKRAATGVAQLADLIEDVERCVVRLDFVSAQGQGCGSGFVVDNGGTIVTNYHVVEEAQSITATFNDKRSLPIEGFKFVVPGKDLAILQTAPPNRQMPFLRLAKKIPRKGESVVAFGSPLGLSFSASEGIVSGIRTSKELGELGVDVAGTWVQMTTQISPGNSGGPLVNLRGEVVAVNTMSVTSGQNLNLAVSCDDVRLALDKARGQAVTALSPDRLPPSKGRRSAARPATEGEIDVSDDVHLAKTDLSPTEASKFESLSKSVWFGVKWVDVVDFDARATRGLPSRSGIVVTEVAYHSPAYRAGIKNGDVIRTIDGKQATQSSVVEELIDEFRAGDSVRISILRPETPGRYSKKDFTVRVEALVSGQVLAHVSRSEIPIEVRDFLKRHLLRYFATLAESINAIEREKKTGVSRLRIGSQPASSTSGLSVKDLRKKSPFDPLFLPAFGSDVPVHVGNIGNLKRVQVLAVMNKKMVVARVNRGLIALLADTSNLIDGQYVDLGSAQIVGTVTLGESSGGRSIKIFVARPLAVASFFPEWNSSGDDER